MVDQKDISESSRTVVIPGRVLTLRKDTTCCRRESSKRSALGYGFVLLAIRLTSLPDR